MMKRNKLNLKRKNKITLLVLVVIMLASLGLIVHKLAVSETKAYFRNSEESQVTLTVTDDVYGSITGQLDLPDGMNTQRTVPEVVYD